MKLLQFLTCSVICGFSNGQLVDSTNRTEITGNSGPNVEKIIANCPRGNDENLNKCFPMIVEELRPYLAAGVPELSLPPLDPFKMESFAFSYGNGPLIIKSVLSNATVRHLSNFSKADIKINTEKKILMSEFEFPFLRMDGNYMLGGNIFFFEVGGNGPYWFEVRGVRATSTSNLQIVTINGARVFQSHGPIQLDLKIDDIKIQLMNLFNGNPILGPVINNVLNDNAQDLFQEIKVPLNKQVAQIVATISDAIALNMPFLTEGVNS